MPPSFPVLSPSPPPLIATLHSHLASTYDRLFLRGAGKYLPPDPLAQFAGSRAVVSTTSSDGSVGVLGKLDWSSTPTGSLTLAHIGDLSSSGFYGALGTISQTDGIDVAAVVSPLPAVSLFGTLDSTSSRLGATVRGTQATYVHPLTPTKRRQPIIALGAKAVGVCVER